MYKRIVVSMIALLVIAAVLAVGVVSADLNAKGPEPESFDPARVVEADAARWVAMGEFYARLDELQRQRSVAADAARWIAKGEFFAGLNTAEVDAARWVAMGEYYARLAKLQLTAERP